MANEEKVKYSPLKIFFDDDTWITVEATLSTTALDVCHLVIRKRSKSPAGLWKEFSLFQASEIDCYLFAVECGDDKIFERRMEDTEYPLTVYDFMRNKSGVDGFKLVFRYLHNPEDVDTASLSDDDEGIFGQSQYMACGERMGYMSKSGGTNRTLRLRYFVLQGDKLHYFKTHQDRYPINYIPLNNCFVRDSPGLHMEIVTTHRIYVLACSTWREKRGWMIALIRASSSKHEQYQTHTLLDSISEEISSISLSWALDFEQTLASVSTLSGALQHGIVTSHLLNFVHAQHSEENLLFWMDAEDYRTKKFVTEKERVARAQEIFDSYVKPGSDHELFVQGRDNFAYCTDKTQSCFISLQKSAFQSLSLSIFPAFLESTHWIRCLLCIPPPIEFPKVSEPISEILSIESPFSFPKSLSLLLNKNLQEDELAILSSSTNSCFTTSPTLVSSPDQKVTPTSQLIAPKEVAVPLALGPAVSVESSIINNSGDKDRSLNPPIEPEVKPRPRSRESVFGAAPGSAKKALPVSVPAVKPVHEHKPSKWSKKSSLFDDLDASESTQTIIPKEKTQAKEVLHYTKEVEQFSKIDESFNDDNADLFSSSFLKKSRSNS